VKFKGAFIGAAAGLALAAAGFSAQAAAVTFSGASHGSPFGPFTEESGFTVSTYSGTLFSNSYGNPGADLEGDINHGGGVAQVVASDSSLFTFLGLDYAAYAPSGVGSQTLIVIGLLYGVQVGFESYTLNNTNIFSPSLANWTMFDASNLAGQALDTLRITLNAGGYGSTQAIDNLRFGPAEAPEPATWAMMLLGIGGVGASLRAVRRRAAVA
jgi:hypothetical protein